jgi:hypothetical protein
MSKEEDKKKPRAHQRRATNKEDIDNAEDDKIQLDARELDQKLKDEFVERLKKKDEETTKKVMIPGMSKAEEELIKKRKLDSEKEGQERVETVKQLREFSRGEYLKLRYKFFYNYSRLHN